MKSKHSSPMFALIISEYVQRSHKICYFFILLSALMNFNFANVFEMSRSAHIKRDNSPKVEVSPIYYSPLCGWRFW